MRPHSEVGTPGGVVSHRGDVCAQLAPPPQVRRASVLAAGETVSGSREGPPSHVAGDAGRPHKPANRGFGCQAHRTCPGAPPPGGKWEPRGRKLQAQHRRPLEPGPPGPSHLPKPGSIQSGPGLGLSMDSRAWIKSTSGLIRGGLPEGQASPPWPPGTPEGHLLQEAPISPTRHQHELPPKGLPRSGTLGPPSWQAGQRGQARLQEGGPSDDGQPSSIQHLNSASSSL